MSTKYFKFNGFTILTVRYPEQPNPKSDLRIGIFAPDNDPVANDMCNSGRWQYGVTAHLGYTVKAGLWEDFGKTIHYEALEQIKNLISCWCANPLDLTLQEFLVKTEYEYYP